MLQHIRPALVLILACTLITGIAYPLAVTAIAQLVVPSAANGSLILKDGKPVGSALIGQAFTSDRYFHGRPSATSAADPADPSKTVDAPYNAAASTGSNLGPITQKLIDRVKSDIEALRREGISGQIPVEAVTASGSGLDPHVTPAMALQQVPRVARARGLTEERVRALVEAQTEGRVLGFIGEPRINVLRLNLALDEVKP